MFDGRGKKSSNVQVQVQLCIFISMCRQVRVKIVRRARFLNKSIQNALPSLKLNVYPWYPLVWVDALNSWAFHSEEA